MDGWEERGEIKRARERKGVSEGERERERRKRRRGTITYMIMDSDGLYSKPTEARQMPPYSQVSKCVSFLLSSCS